MIGRRYAKKKTKTDADGTSHTYIKYNDQKLELDVNTNTLTDDELRERLDKIEDFKERVDTLRNLYPNDLFPTSLMVLFIAVLNLYAFKAVGNVTALTIGISALLTTLTLPFIWTSYKSWYYGRLYLELLNESTEAALALESQTPSSNTNTSDD